MKVSHILGLTLTVSLLSFGGWVGCGGDSDNKNNPDGLDAASFPKDTSVPDTAKPADDDAGDAADMDAAATVDAGDAATTPDTGIDSGSDAATIVDASDAG